MVGKLSIKIIIIITTLILIGFVSYNHKESNSEYGFHPDEFLYTYYAGLFKSYVELDFNNVCWKSKLRHNAVPAGLYWIGLTLYFSDYNNLLVKPTKIWTLKGPDFLNQISSYKKNHPLLDIENRIYVFRKKILIFRALAFASLFIFAFVLCGYWCALLTIYFLIQNPEFLWISSLVMLETIWLFQYILNLLFIYFYFYYRTNYPDRKRIINLLIILIAISTGLLAATKISGFINILVLIIYFFSYIRQKNSYNQLNKTKISSDFIQIGLVLFLSLVIFIIVNPALYDNPILGMYNIMINRLRILNQQIISQPELYLPHFTSRLIFLKNYLAIDFKKMIFFLVGIFSLFFEIKKSFSKNDFVNPKYFFALSFFSLAIITLIFMRLAYKRYALILLPFIYLVISYGIITIFKKIILKIRWKIWKYDISQITNIL